MPSMENPDGSFLNEGNGGPITVIQPSSGSTYAMPWNLRDLYIDVSGTLGSLTLLLPGTRTNGDTVEIMCNHTITTLTLHDNLGNAITGAPTTITANAAIIMKWMSGNAQLGIAQGWVYWK